MSPATHLRYEILRTLRNPRSLGITLALPLVIFFAVAGAGRGARVEGISFPLYFMGAMAAYGAMYAAIPARGPHRLGPRSGLDPGSCASRHFAPAPHLRLQGTHRLPDRPGEPARTLPGRHHASGSTWLPGGGWRWEVCCWSVWPRSS